MAAELKDFRGKITDMTWCYLEAESRATGRDHSEIVRELLHEWAEQRHNVTIVAQKLMSREGSGGQK